jgi:hypothetical protein
MVERVCYCQREVEHISNSPWDLEREYVYWGMRLDADYTTFVANKERKCEILSLWKRMSRIIGISCRT